VRSVFWLYAQRAVAFPAYAVRYADIILAIRGNVTVIVYTVKAGRVTGRSFQSTRIHIGIEVIAVSWHAAREEAVSVFVLVRGKVTRPVAVRILAVTGAPRKRREGVYQRVVVITVPLREWAERRSGISEIIAVLVIAALALIHYAVAVIVESVVTFRVVRQTRLCTRRTGNTIIYQCTIFACCCS
jgi:hypothetical protein